MVVILMLILALAGMLAWRLARSVKTLVKREAQIPQMEKMDALGRASLLTRKLLDFSHDNRGERKVVDVGDELRGKRLLMVEDEPELAEMAAEILEDAGIAVTVVDDADAAPKRFEPGLFDVLVIDLILPGSVDGIDIATTAVRRDAAIRVLLTSGNTLDARERQKKPGLSFEVLPKPCSDDQLLHCLRRLFR